MTSRVITTSLSSLLFGALIAGHHTFISGVNPVIVQSVMAILLAVILFNIYKSPSKKQLLIQALILASATCIGAKVMSNSAERQLDGYIRRYHKVEEKK